MGLVGDAGAEHRHIQPVSPIVDGHGMALQARLGIVDAVPPAGLVEVILAAGPHEHGGLLRVSGNDGAALGVGGRISERRRRCLCRVAGQKDRQGAFEGTKAL